MINSSLPLVSPGVIFTTIGSEQEAATLARALVEKHLAACVKIFPVNSTYRWQGEICVETEWQLMIKTSLEKFDEIQQAMCELHSYEVPELVTVPISGGSNPYLTWMAAQVGVGTLER